MKTRFTFLLSFLISFTLLALAGCNLPSAEQNSFQTSVAGTLAAENAGIPSAEPVDINLPPPELPSPTHTITLSPTFTLSPTLTHTSTITPTSTLEVPMVSVSVNTNCRTGPGTIYDIVGALLVGEQAEVVGKGEFGYYWIIKNPDGAGECWLWSNYAIVTGPTDGLTEYSPPPTPTPTFVWSGAWNVSLGPAGGGVYLPWSMTSTVTGNAFNGIVDFMGSFATYNGTISDDYLTVTGNWEEMGVTGPFKFYAVGANQFQGNYSYGTDDYGICGVKGGGALPSPCYRP